MTGEAFQEIEATTAGGRSVALRFPAEEHAARLAATRAEMNRRGLDALLVFAPVLSWNAEHDWTTFRFNFAVRHEKQESSLLSPLEYLGAQAACLGPLLFLSACAAVAAVARGWRTAGPVRLQLVLATLVPVLGFLAISFRRKIGFHWPAAAWLPLVILISVRWSAAAIHCGRGSPSASQTETFPSR